MIKTQMDKIEAKHLGEYENQNYYSSTLLVVIGILAVRITQGSTKSIVFFSIRLPQKTMMKDTF